MLHSSRHEPETPMWALALGISPCFAWLDRGDLAGPSVPGPWRREDAGVTLPLTWSLGSGESP